MYTGSIYHGDIIEAFTSSVPGSYVRDYRDRGGFIVIARNYRDIKWRDQTTTAKVYRQVPAVTLVNIPRGNVTARTIYNGVRLIRPGWREQFRKSMRHLTQEQGKLITKKLGCGQVFPEG